MADWETEVGLRRALWLWRESAAWRKRRTAKRRLERQERKLSASLFIKKEVGLRIIWIGVGWMEFLQKLQGEQLAALSRHWIIWSGVTAKYVRVRMQVGIAEVRRRLKRSRRQAEEVPHHQRLWEGGFCCGIANCHHQRCDPTGLVITTVFALGVIRLVW